MKPDAFFELFDGEVEMIYGIWPQSNNKVRVGITCRNGAWEPVVPYEVIFDYSRFKDFMESTGFNLIGCLPLEHNITWQRFIAKYWQLSEVK